MPPPTSAESLFQQARRHFDARDVNAAEHALRAALALDPGFAEAEANLAYALDTGGRKAQAEQHYRRAIALAPHLLQIRLNLGAMLTALRRFDAALAVYRDALALAPDDAALHANLGMTLACAGREQEAEACYRSALARHPGHTKAAFNLSYLLLRQGRWEEGWQRLEARASIGVLQRHVNLPRWQGEALAGKTILVAAEAGQGDMIQFCRYCMQLKEAGAARVGVLCHPGLVALLTGLQGADEAIGLDRVPQEGAWDYWVPAMSLPLRLRTTLDSVPAPLPYLAVDSERGARLAPLLDTLPGECKVGLVWKGNPRFENDEARSLPSLATLAPLAAVEGIRWFSLQKGAGEEEARRGVPGLAPFDLAPHIGDFADTAALVDGLDLVITVDTAVAHLCGALARPCWVLLPDYLPDWRWGEEGSATPWYPGVMRLWRQHRGGAWDALVAGMVPALAAWRSARRR